LEEREFNFRCRELFGEQHAGDLAGVDGGRWAPGGIGGRRGMLEWRHASVREGVELSGLNSVM